MQASSQTMNLLWACGDCCFMFAFWIKTIKKPLVRVLAGKMCCFGYDCTKCISNDGFPIGFETPISIKMMQDSDFPTTHTKLCICIQDCHIFSNQLLSIPIIENPSVVSISYKN